MKPQKQISQIPGVAQVLIFGQQKYAVRIEADPDLAAARGLTLNDIRTAVIASNSAAPVGGLRGNTRNMTLTAIRSTSCSATAPPIPAVPKPAN
jgi:HAE1 family hydrophobic/amphiphilic exporter-1